jgi:hypothetical protein
MSNQGRGSHPTNALAPLAALLLTACGSNVVAPPTADASSSGKDDTTVAAAGTGGFGTTSTTSTSSSSTGGMSAMAAEVARVDPDGTVTGLFVSDGPVAPMLASDADHFLLQDRTVRVSDTRP